MSKETEMTNLQYAMQIHQNIIINGGIAANALCEMCRNLKIMRDEKLYETLGYKDFDTYSEKMAGIRARQAYTYISTFENLGEGVLQSTANIGITKLSLIAQLPPAERAEAIINRDEIAGMTVAEVKDLVAKAKHQGEQLSMLSEKINEKDKDIQIILEERESLTQEITQKENVVEELTQKLKTTEKALHDQPVSSPADIDKITAAAKAAAEAGYKADIDKLNKTYEKNLKKEVSEAVTQERKSAEDRIKAEYDQKIKQLEETAKEEKLRAEALEKQLKLSDNDITTVKIYLESVKDTFKKCIAFLQTKQSGSENYLKCSTAVLKMAEMLHAEAEELNK